MRIMIFLLPPTEKRVNKKMSLTTFRLVFSRYSREAFLVPTRKPSLDLNRPAVSPFGILVARVANIMISRYSYREPLLFNMIFNIPIHNDRMYSRGEDGLPLGKFFQGNLSQGMIFEDIAVLPQPAISCDYA